MKAMTVKKMIEAFQSILPQSSSLLLVISHLIGNAFANVHTGNQKLVQSFGFILIQ